jgi:hypothetical protein
MQPQQLLLLCRDDELRQRELRMQQEKLEVIQRGPNWKQNEFIESLRRNLSRKASAWG